MPSDPGSPAPAPPAAIVELPRPLLDAGLAARAREALGDLARDLAAVPASRGPAWDRMLAGGGAGLALGMAFLACSGLVEVGEADALARLQAAVDGLEQAFASPSLFSGFTGTAWVVEFLQDGFIERDETLNQDIDAALLACLGHDPPPSCELIDGLAGLGVYALERFPRGASATLLETLFDRVEARAAWSREGARWAAPALPDAVVAAYGLAPAPPGTVDLGLSHGQPGVIAFLAALVLQGIRGERARTLLEGAVGWLLAHEGTTDGRSAFTHVIEPGADVRPSCRLAWCYGDLGIALALGHAGRAAAREDWSARAVALLEAAARREPAPGEVEDPMLCHGAMGVAHLFHRAFLSTGRDSLRAAATDWTRRALDFHTPGAGLGGFRRRARSAWHDDPGLLEGSMGLALALLAALEPRDPAWDRCLLLSLRP
ncbi:MAG: lanthionine synthetase C family protein [Holophagaceae bacterium]